MELVRFRLLHLVRNWSTQNSFSGNGKVDIREPEIFARHEQAFTYRARSVISF